MKSKPPHRFLGFSTLPLVHLPSWFACPWCRNPVFPTGLGLSIRIESLPSSCIIPQVWGLALGWWSGNQGINGGDGDDDADGDEWS